MNVKIEWSEKLKRSLIICCACGKPIKDTAYASNEGYTHFEC